MARLLQLNIMPADNNLADKMDTEGAIEDCTNSIDDDGDTNIDCADSDCAEDPGCKDGY